MSKTAPAERKLYQVGKHVLALDDFGFQVYRESVAKSGKQKGEVTQGQHSYHADLVYAIRALADRISRGQETMSLEAYISRYRDAIEEIKLVVNREGE